MQEQNIDGTVNALVFTAYQTFYPDHLERFAHTIHIQGCLSMKAANKPLAFL